MLFTSLRNLECIRPAKSGTRRELSLACLQDTTQLQSLTCPNDEEDALVARQLFSPKLASKGHFRVKIQTIQNGLYSCRSV